MAAGTTTSTVVRITNYYDDDTKSYVTINNIAEMTEQQISALKTNIQNFNSDPSEYSALMVSKYGAQWRGISAARVTITEKNYIF